MCDDVLIEGSVGGEFLEVDDGVEIAHVVRVVGDGVLYVAEELCLLLQAHDRVHSTPQFLVG